ncbi:MAG: oleate hydratase, partial [Candidatus Magasanikbacteria bacterium]|nr:oleate hydratase [Candidatus Magasanikbacteria bacterium]
DSSLGSMTEAPRLQAEKKNPAWELWENLAENQIDFGKPAVFNTQVDKSKWTSFSITLRDPKFFKLMEKFVDKKINDFGGVNLIESNWLISVVLSYKPYFLNQPADITFCWGYGLFPDKEGNFVKKKLCECNGEEILTEVCYHLGFEKELDEILSSAICLPCYMPYITSQFLPRAKGDRPLVRPKNLKNLAFIGQYCEMPKDVVFTVEYSIRSAQTAVYSLTGLNKKVVPIYDGTHHLKVVLAALKTFLR